MTYNEPPEIATSPDARGVRLDEIMAGYGLHLTIGNAHARHILGDVDSLMQHVSDVADQDTTLVRFCAGVFRMWSETFDAIAVWVDDEHAQRAIDGAGGIDAVADLLSTMTPDEPGGCDERDDDAEDDDRH